MSSDYALAVTYTADVDAIGSKFEIVAGQNRITMTVRRNDRMGRKFTEL